LGHLEVVEWMFSEYKFPFDTGVTWAAAYHGHLHILQWLIAKGFRWSMRDAYAAAEQGHLEVLKWALANGAPYAHHQLLVAAQKQPAIHTWLTQEFRPNAAS
jgi:hypothetical protein